MVLSDWQSFYVLVGSSAAALTGLTFVVITISAERGDIAGSASARLTGLRVFITPTAVHFCAALWLSALMSIPGQTAAVLQALLAATGLGGLISCATLLRPMFARTFGSKPFVSDWIWNFVLPVVAYSALTVTGFMFPHQSTPSLYAVGGVVLLLMVPVLALWLLPLCLPVLVVLAVVWAIGRRSHHSSRAYHV